MVVSKHCLTEVKGRRSVTAPAMTALRAFAARYHLRIPRARLSPRNLTIAGRSADISRAFGITRIRYSSPEGEFFGYPGAISIPRRLAGIIAGVIGLSEFPVRRITSHRTAISRPKVSFHPVQMCRLYNFPRDFDGSGQRIALIELGGGFRIKELRKYFHQQKLRLPKITVVSVDGVRNRPRSSSTAVDLEVQGDIETLGSVAPGAEIVVYFAPSTERGLYDAIVKAVHDRTNKPGIISISFGEVEVFWTARTLHLLDDVLRDAAMLGITVCCAAGDTGSSGGVRGGKPHVYFPASSPHVLACGGTEVTAKDGRIVRERVWRAGRDSTTGGGISRIFARPPYQASVDVPRSPNLKLKQGRGLPDVAANAAAYRLMANGKTIVIGGTSAVAPLWAGLVARINEKRGQPLGFLNPVLYGMYEMLLDLGAIRQITHGSNGSYRARKGWNPCTGLGAPDGVRLARHLSPQR